MTGCERAAIAVRRPFPDQALIDDGHLATVIQQGQGGRQTGNTGTDHQTVDGFFRLGSIHDAQNSLVVYRQRRKNGDAQPPSMLVTAFAVHMAMRQFFFAGLAHFNDFNIEGQIFASHRVI